MPKNYSTEDYDVIYLQTEEFPETTWCVDQINDDDVKYLLATPEREAAPELYRACIAGKKYDEAIRQCSNDPEKMASFCTSQGDTLDTLYMDWMTKIRHALALAEKETNKNA